MSVLLYSGCSVRTELRRDMTRLWSRVMRQVNPNIDMLLFDSASEYPPETYIEPGILISHFGDNPGHLSHGGFDGAGRTFFAGIEYAANAGYDYAVTCETDLLFVRPINEVVERMDSANVKVACLQMNEYRFFEWGFVAINVAWARDIEWEQKYDWRNPKPSAIPELRNEWICGNDLFILPYRGIRNSGPFTDAANLPRLFPYGPPDWIHENNAKDLSVMHAFLKLNGMAT